MSENPQWEVQLARSSDMSGIGSLPYAFSLNTIFNRPGSLSMTIPLDSEIAYSVAKHSTAVTCQRNDSVKWSGSIISVSKNASDMTMSISAIGWIDELYHRFVRIAEEASLVFTDVASGTIVGALISVVNAQTDDQGVVQPTHVRFGGSFDTQLRTRSYKRGQNFGQALQELIDIENGIDIVVDPITRAITTYPPTNYRDLTNVNFTHGINCTVTENDDGSSTANRISAVGSNGIIVPADDATAIAAAGIMREEWLSLSDVANTIIIGAYANAELVYRRYGQKTYEIRPAAFGDVPRLYDDFELGDKIYISADGGALQVDNQAVRVFSVPIEVDAQGNEVQGQIATAPQ